MGGEEVKVRFSLERLWLRRRLVEIVLPRPRPRPSLNVGGLRVRMSVILSVRLCSTAPTARTVALGLEHAAVGDSSAAAGAGERLGWRVREQQQC